MVDVHTLQEPVDGAMPCQLKYLPDDLDATTVLGHIRVWRANDVSWLCLGMTFQLLVEHRFPAPS